MTGQYLWPFFCSSLSCPQAFIRDCCRLWLVAFLKCLKGEEISLKLELHLFNSLKEIKVSMWLFFFTGLLCHLSLPRKAAGCGFGVTDVLSFPLPTRETCCPGELHLPLALFTLCKLSPSLTSAQTCSRTQLSWLVKFYSRGAAFPKKESILL